MPEDQKTKISDDIASAKIDPDAKVMDEMHEEIKLLKKKRGEDAFLILLVFVIIIDIVFLLDATNWSAPLGVMILQIVGLMVVAERLEVFTAKEIFTRIIGILGSR